MIKYFPTAARDSNVKELFKKIVNNIAGPVDAIYLEPADFKFLDTVNLTSPTVIIATSDTLGHETGYEYNYWRNPQIPTEITNFVFPIIEQNRDKTFILLFIGNYQKYLNFDFNNVVLIPWNPILEQDYYKMLSPVVDKNLKSTRIGIALNRQMRQHRLALASLLRGKGFSNRCYITAMHLYKQLAKNSSQNFMDHCNWEFEPNHNNNRDQMIQGFIGLINDYVKESDIYPTVDNTDFVTEFSNSDNFDSNLRPLYNNSFVEFVSCTEFAQPTTQIDEKFINSVIGYNFPIIIGSRGTVKFIRDSGFDMFDDVVDHSYDNIDNPVDRIISAVESNQHLITDYATTIKRWVECRPRFDANFNFTHLDMHKLQEQRTLSACNQQIPNLLKEPFND